MTATCPAGARVWAALFLVCFFGCKDPTEPEKTGGETWLTYTAENSGLGSNAVLSISFDAGGRKWIGTAGGVSELAGAVWTTFTTANGLSNNRITCIAPGRDVSVWFGTGGTGVNRYIENDPTQVWRSYTVLNGIPDGWIYSLAIDYYGDAWIGTNGGVGQFVETPGSTTHAGVWKTYGTGDGLPETHITAVAVDVNNLKWCGTAYSGIASFDGTAWQSYPLPQGIQMRITSIAVDKNNTKWIGTWAGLLRFDGRSWAVYDTTAGLASNTVNAVAVQGGTVVWCGTDRGASRFDGTRWTTFTRANSSLLSDTVTAVAAQINRNVWFGTSRGVAVYNENGIQ
jgi:ligand-binding sensor domain-containing protein